MLARRGVLETDLWQAIAVAIGGFGLGVVATLIAVAWQTARLERIPPARGIIPFAEPHDRDNWEARVDNTQGLMTAQDTITWAVSGISFATQATLAGFFFLQSGPGADGRTTLPVLGIGAAIGFLLVILRSNSYMVAYMGLLSSTRRREYNLPRRPSFLPRAMNVVKLEHGLVALGGLVLIGTVVT